MTFHRTFFFLSEREKLQTSVSVHHLRLFALCWRWFYPVVVCISQKMFPILPETPLIKGNHRAQLLLRRSLIGSLWCWHFSCAGEVIAAECTVFHVSSLLPGVWPSSVPQTDATAGCYSSSGSSSPGSCCGWKYTWTWISGGDRSSYQ